jgi:thiol-disulfide isomerase/thioredoxin
MRLIATGLFTACLLTTSAAVASDADRAHALIDEVAKAYRDAPTITDTITLDLDGEQSIMRLRFGQDNKRVQFDVPGYAIMVIDGKLMVTSEAVPNKYMESEIEGTVTEALIATFGSPESIPFHFVMRDNRGMEAYLNSLTFGFLHQPQISGFTPAGDNDSDHHVVSLSDAHGDAFVHIHPETKLIRKIRAELPPIPGMGNEKINVTVTTDPVIADELADAIAFDPGDRTAVDSPDKLVPQMIEVGAAAPDFSLPNLDGEKVTLSDLRGKIVVLDFWATWCIPCIRVLPDVERFAKWAKDEGLPVRVFAVNVWEHRGDTREERTQIASEFWKERGFELENLMDYDDSLINAMAIDSIPTTVVIDPEGRVHEVHVGYTPRIFDMLKQIITAALDEASTEG